MNHPLTENTAAMRQSDNKGAFRGSAFLGLLPVVGLSLAAAMFVGCSSSSSSRDRTGPGEPGDPPPGFEGAAPQFADERGSYGDSVEAGDDVDLPMYQQGFRVNGDQRSLAEGEDNDANFRLRGNGSSISIETRDREFAWDRDPGDGAGELSAYRFDSADGTTVEGEIVSAYLDYVHFGYWAQTDQAIEDFSATASGFHMGHETRDAAIAALANAEVTDASYSGVTHGTGWNGGDQYAFDGTVALNVNFATGIVDGSMNTTINDFSISGQIEDNRFSGNVTGEAGGAMFSGTEGSLSGGFYGADAEEVGGSYGLQDGNNVAAGAFGASRQ